MDKGILGMKRALLLPAVAAALLITLQALQPALSQSDPEPDAFQFIKTFEGKVIAFAGCSGDQDGVCSAGGQAPFPVTLPTSMGSVDVTVTMTIEYRTDPKDGWEVAMDMTSPGERTEILRPGYLNLRPGPSASTSITWFRRSVPPNDQPHEFDFRINARKLRAPNLIRVTKMVLVIEATPSG